MFIKKTTNSAGQVYYHLVESYWEKGRSKQRTLLSLGRAEEGRLDNLIEAISRHKEVMSILDMAKAISVQDTYIYGPLVILEKIFERHGINEILQRIQEKHPQLGFNLREVVFTLVACRFIKPGSKLEVYEHGQKKLYPKMVNQKIELQQLYRAMSLLSQHREKIEEWLYWHDRDLLNMQVDVVLYDLTTLRFESTREDLGKLRRFGYSKEMRSDCTQVVLGLLVDTDGIPLGFEVYPGNTFEGKTLEGIVEKMRRKFKVRRFIFVADRGLFSSKNLEHLRASGGEFIVGMKLGTLRKRHSEFYDRSRFQWIHPDLAVYETKHQQDRCIITWSRARAKRDQRTREDILAKIRKKLSAQKISSKTFVSNRNYHQYLTGLAEGQPALNESAIQQAATKDGFFGVLTNIPHMPATEVIQDYKHLWIIEDAFGEIKGSLKARPIFHWNDERIVGHLTLCFLAYFCESQLAKSLREKKLMLESDAIAHGVIKKRPLTVLAAMNELKEVRAIPVQVRGHLIWVRTDVSGNAVKLFKAAGTKPPPRVLNLDSLS